MGPAVRADPRTIAEEDATGDAPGPVTTLLAEVGLDGRFRGYAAEILRSRVANTVVHTVLQGGWLAAEYGGGVNDMEGLRAAIHDSNYVVGWPPSGSAAVEPKSAPSKAMQN